MPQINDTICDCDISILLSSFLVRVTVEYGVVEQCFHVHIECLGDAVERDEVGLRGVAAPLAHRTGRFADLGGEPPPGFLLLYEDNLYSVEFWHSLKYLGLITKVHD